jgi:hypothetical protein
MNPMALATDTTDLKKCVALTGQNYMSWYLITWARLQKKKHLHVIADTNESPPAAVSADGAYDKTDDPVNKKRTTAAPPTITDEQEAEAYDLLIGTISELVFTRLRNVERTGSAVSVTLRKLYESATPSNISEERWRITSTHINCSLRSFELLEVSCLRQVSQTRCSAHGTRPTTTKALKSRFGLLPIWPPSLLNTSRPSLLWRHTTKKRSLPVQ